MCFSPLPGELSIVNWQTILLMLWIDVFKTKLHDTFIDFSDSKHKIVDHSIIYRIMDDNNLKIGKIEGFLQAHAEKTQWYTKVAKVWSIA